MLCFPSPRLCYNDLLVLNPSPFPHSLPSPPVCSQYLGVCFCFVSLFILFFALICGFFFFLILPSEQWESFDVDGFPNFFTVSYFQCLWEKAISYSCKNRGKQNKIVFFTKDYVSLQVNESRHRNQYFHLQPFSFFAGLRRLPEAQFNRVQTCSPLCCDPEISLRVQGAGDTTWALSRPLGER